MSTTPIAVIADNQDHLVHLPQTVYDPTLSKSLICKHKAFATHGLIKPTNPITLTTGTGQCLTSSATITLRWRYDAALQSFQETFFIVDGLGEHDAVLRSGIERLDPDARPEGPTTGEVQGEGHGDGDGKVLGNAFPFMIGKPGKPGQLAADQKNENKQQRDAEYLKQVDTQKRNMKKQLEALKRPQQP